MRKWYLLMNGNNDNQGGGGSGYESPGDESSIENEKDTLDDLGYEKVQSEEKPNDQNGEQKKEDPPQKKEEESGESLTGYGDDSNEGGEAPKKDGEAPVEGEKEKAGDDGKGEPDLGDTKDFLQEEIDLIKATIKEAGLDEKAAKALVDYKRKEIAKLKEIAQKRKDESAQAEKDLKASWVSELKQDPTFGGENFATNVKKVDKILNDFMPNIKKRLTETKGMLPPYIMRDLSKMAAHLYGTEKFNQGEGQSVKDGKEITEDDEIQQMYS